MPVDFQNDLLLITAAGGKQASALLPHLVKKWARLRLVVASSASKDRLSAQYPMAEVVQADLDSKQACHRVLDGVTACFLVTPAFHYHEVAIGQNMIDAALESHAASEGKFRYMLRSSVLHPMIRKLVNHDNKRVIEEYLAESGLPYTVIQPSHMMETLQIRKIIEYELESFPRLFDPRTPFSFTCAEDVGEAAARILDEPEKHLYATYELVSTSEPMSYSAVERILSEELGRTFAFEKKPTDEGIELFSSVLSGGESEHARFEFKQNVAMLLTYYDRKGLLGNPNVLEMILGRKPTQYREWVRNCIQESKS